MDDPENAQARRALPAVRAIVATAQPREALSRRQAGVLERLETRRRARKNLRQPPTNMSGALRLAREVLPNESSPLGRRHDLVSLTEMKAIGERRRKLGEVLERLDLCALRNWL